MSISPNLETPQTELREQIVLHYLNSLKIMKKPAMMLALEILLTIFPLVSFKTEYHHQNHHNWPVRVVMPLVLMDDYRNY